MKHSELVDSGATPTEIQEFLVEGGKLACALVTLALLALIG